MAALPEKVRLYRSETGSLWRELAALLGETFSLVFSPDGRTLAGGGTDGIVRMWELATGTRRLDLPAHEGAVHALAFSPDGRTLATASMDGTVRFHDLTASAITWKLPPATWTTLASPDAAEAEGAFQALKAAPEAALALFSKHLRPAPAVNEAEVRRLLDEIDAPRFAVRSLAARSLEAIGLPALPILRQALTGQPTLEVRRRIERLVEAMEDVMLSAEELRQGRAVEVLEHLGTPAAKRLLKALADGTPGALQTQAARSALSRWPR